MTSVLDQALVPHREKDWSRSWCGCDCSMCQNFECKMLRGLASEALDDLVRKRLLAGGNLATLPITREAKKWCVLMLRAVSHCEKLTSGEEAILMGVHATTLSRSKRGER